MQICQPVFPASGIRCTEVIDEKLHGCLLSLHFAVPRDARTAPMHALLTDLLTAASADYPEIGALSARLDALYAADLSASLILCGDSTDLHFTASWLDDALTPDRKPITGAVLGLVLGCLLRPHAQNGSFDEALFAVCRQNLLDEIDAVLGNKREYALQLAAETAFAGEPAAIAPQGDRDLAMEVTPQECYALWLEILQTAPIEIIAVLPRENPQIMQMLREGFANIARKPRPVTWLSPSPCRAEPVRAEDGIAVSQSKLVLVYKYSDIPRRTAELLTKMLSGTGTSLLFVNVREREGLCYDCSATHSALKCAVVIECGVQPGREQAAADAICAQIEALQTGDFPDSLCEEAKLSTEYAAALSLDSASGIEGRIAAAYRCGETPALTVADPAVRRLTRADLTEAACRLRLDTVLMLHGTETEANP